LNENTLHGYLAYVDGVSIDWCNANDKATFLRFDFDAEINTFIRGSGSRKIKTVTCFVIAPEYRSKGVATALLECVVSDAKSDGYAAVEAYPRLRDQRETFDFTGPVRLYEKMGFVEVAKQGNVAIMRKKLEGLR
jgi:GNAT superfamily N-acetyltransferase